MKTSIWTYLLVAGTLTAQETLPVSELWLRQFPGVGMEAGFDSDGDGFPDLEEGVAATDPFDPGSFLNFEARYSESTGLVDFTWQGEPGKLYLIEIMTSEEGGWETLTGTIPTVRGRKTLSLAPEGRLLARLVVRDIDRDQDGVSGWEESLLGWDDGDPRSAGTDTHDYAALLGMLEGTGELSLAGGTISVPRAKPSIAETSLFLSQASFGGSRAMIDEVRETGLVGWLDAQLTTEEVTLTEPLLFSEDDLRDGFTWSKTWWGTVMRSEDQLRLRTAYALSQIFVISGASNDAIRNGPELQGYYYDLLIANAFGNYRDLLEDVTFSTQMGSYLSHLLNSKRDDEAGRFPDENYAREVMQLFSIGLWKLNPDGSLVFDENGEAVPTYDNGVVAEMAKVFTGFAFGAPRANSFYNIMPALEWNYPMRLYDDFHSQGEKRLFNGVVIPDGQTASEDISMALDLLSAHDNVGPFVGKLLIQRLVCSDPGPEYLQRVTRIWNDNGEGVRGDLKAVMRAVLLDPQARNPALRHAQSGKVREPILRLAHLLRFFESRNQENPPTYPLAVNFLDRDLGQRPLFSPSVFNFYLSSYRPPGVAGEGRLVSPELQISTPAQFLNTDNLLEVVTRAGYDPRYMPPAKVVHLNLRFENDTILQPADLFDNLNQYFASGRFSDASRKLILNAVEAEPSFDKKIQMMVHLIADAPEFVTFN